MLLHQVGDDFGVGFGFENVALRVQLVLQGQVVFDDAVVHHHHVARAVAVRMGVLLGGAAVRGPAGVADAERAIHGFQADGILQVAEFALGAPDGELIVVAVNG